MVKTLLIVVLLFAPLLADESVELSGDSTKAKDRLNSFYEKRLDSLEKELQEIPLVIRIPEQRSEFERQMGLLSAPAPETIEPNGIVLEADPTVDLKMIYPKATRDKVVKVKRKKWQRPAPHVLE